MRKLDAACAVFFVCAGVAFATASAGAPRGGGGDPSRESQGRSSESGVAVVQAPVTAHRGCFPSSEAVPDPLGPKNRFLSFSAGDPGGLQAIRITFSDLPAPFDIWNGKELWVGEPRWVCQFGCCVYCGDQWASILAATLQREPFYASWMPGLTVHVFHEGIIPEGNYRIQVIDQTCSVDDESSFSDPLEMTTAKWGDTVRDCVTIPCPPPDGVVNIIDVAAILARFASDPRSIVKPRADLEPGCLDLVINMSDLLYAIAAFQGLDYPFEPTALDPCDSTCVNPLP